MITIGEIKQGIEKLPGSQRKRRLNNWLTEELLIRFNGKILHIDLDVILTWGKLVARLESRGHALPAIDSLIAATALHQDLALVTRNERDFDGTDVVVVSPWLA